MEKHIEDYWNVNGEKELSDAWTGFTRFILLNERPPDGYTWSGKRLTRKQNTSRPYDIWPDMWTSMSDASKKKAKQGWAIEKPILDNGRRLRGIFFIEPNVEELEHTMKNARRKLKIPMSAAMLCKNTSNLPRRNLPQHWETQDQICLCCRCRRILCAQVSRRSHCCKRNTFIEP